MDVSIILINHNTKKLTQQTIQSILDTVKRVSYEVIVVDNSNQESEILEMDVPGLRIFSHIENKGFGHACNFGVTKAQGEYLLFLNSDTILYDNTLDESVAYFKKNPNIGILGIHTLLADGSLDHGCKRGFPTPMASLYYFTGMDKRHPESRKYGAYRQTFVDETSVTEVDAVSGAYMLMKKDIFSEIGGFDEDYFMYGEDLDLCYRVKQKGYQIIYYGKVCMTHLKGQSGLNTNPVIVDHFYRAMVIFYNKHYRKKYNPITNGIVLLGIRIKRALQMRKVKKRN